MDALIIAHAARISRLRVWIIRLLLPDFDVHVQHAAHREENKNLENNRMENGFIPFIHHSGTNLIVIPQSEI